MVDLIERTFQLFAARCTSSLASKFGYPPGSAMPSKARGAVCVHRRFQCSSRGSDRSVKDARISTSTWCGPPERGEARLTPFLGLGTRVISTLVVTAYGSYGVNADRLIKARRHFDPDNTFNSAIPLPAGPGVLTE